MSREFKTPALLASSEERGEHDAIVRWLTPGAGALSTLARGLRRPASKLAPLLKPACELNLRLMLSGGTAILAGANVATDFAQWRDHLPALALYWFMLDCALAGAAAEETNAPVYQLTVNLLRSESALQHLPGCGAVFVLKLLAIHGLLPSLTTCALDGHRLSPDEPLHLLPNGEGVIGRPAFNAHYARSGGGLLRLNPARAERWRRLAHGPLLDYPAAAADLEDVAVLVDLAARVIGATANRPLRTVRFLEQQWRLPAVADLLARQRT